MSYKDKRRKLKEMYGARREERAAERKLNIQTKYKKPAFTPLKARTGRFVETPEMQRIRLLPSLTSSAQAARADSLKNMDFTMLEQRVLAFMPEGFIDWSDEQRAEWAARELAAWEETERKKKMVAPICNKGGLQYVADVPEEVRITLGRKV